MTDETTFDVVCLGRALVDLYAEQIGSRLEDATSFAKYVGGSSCNIAIGTARLGLRSAMLTRVGDEHMGRYVRETLEHEGVDVSQLVTDQERLTALVVLGIKDRDTFPLIFYRENCADMALSEDDIDERFIASARALLITGTHLSQKGVLAASRAALMAARRNGVKRVLDIDYRPVLWGLTSRGEGENRFVADQSVTDHLQQVLPEFDLVVGTEEEIHIAGGSTDTVAALRAIRAVTPATLVLKRGALGATVFEGDIPDALDDGITVPGVTVDVLNVLGAGDAFISGFLRGWLRGESHEQSLRYANACGALVVSRHGCSPAMPTATELDHYIDNAARIPRPDCDAELNHLHHVTTRRGKWDDMCIFAFDHRIQFFEMAQEAGGNPGDLPRLKSLLVDAAMRGAQRFEGQRQTGVLIDDTYGQDALNAVTGRGWWIGRPVELPRSRPLEFEGGDSIGSRLVSWPREHVVKCLVFYHPDDESWLRHQQEQKVQTLYSACRASGHELLLEVIPPDELPSDDATLSRSLKRFYNLGVRPDWWKLPPMSRAAWAKVDAVIGEQDPHCRGVLLLGLGASFETLKQGFRDAAGQPLCKGFAVGRSVFGEPCRRWLAGEIGDQGLVDDVVARYLELVDLWTQSRRAA